MAARYMTEQEERFWRYALTNDEVAASFLANQARYGHNVQNIAAHQYICPRCESIALVHMGGVMCGKCGTYVPKEKTHLLKTHIHGGFYK